MTRTKKQILPALHNSGKLSDPDLPDIGEKNYTATILKYTNLALQFPQLKTDAKQVVPAINECRVIANPVPIGAVLETESGEPIQAENGFILEPDGDYSSEDSGGVDAEMLRTIQIKDTVYSIEGGGGTSDYSDLTNKPTINNVTLSGNKTTSELLISYADILNTPSLKTVATSGKYTDLSSKPQINGHTLTGNQSSADLGIATSLTNLTDVNVSSAQNDDVLKYDSVTSKWINATICPTHHYSEIEQITGTWTDGVPIYEQSFPISQNSFSTGWKWFSVNLTCSQIIDAEVSLKDSTSTYCYTNMPAVYRYSDGAVGIYNGLGGNLGNVTGYITVRYIK